ncbi:glutathione binding-like protein [Plesiomonas shigelloides]|uniref:glutathione binding-like protein n=1 Tax=Plesiomonas shigelloides TaxID=703 RepID=UPI001C49886F
MVLHKRHSLLGENYSLADISLYAYTHIADEGGFNLREFPQICAWLARIEAQPGHQPSRNV